MVQSNCMAKIVAQSERFAGAENRWERLPGFKID